MRDPVVTFAEGRWTAGVVGLGYVGLPLVMTAVEAGLPVIGFDVSAERVADLAAGRSHVEDVSDATLARALAAGARFTAFVGSARKAQTLKEKLAAKGADADALARLAAPAGLPIGAATAEEIALSILAQVVQIRRAASQP